MTSSVKHSRTIRQLALAVVIALLGGMLAACSGSATAQTAGATVVNVGYFPNVTHAPGLLADAEGFLTKRLGVAGATVATKSFNAGPDVIQAILSGSLDISYIGPNPTVTAYIQSRGAGVRVIAGSTSGGASLVVRPDITSAAELRGRKLATPQLGNTQDIALRHWLGTQGLTATKEGGGDVSILPQANSAAVQAFTAGQIDGAWVPEPYATRLVQAVCTGSSVTVYTVPASTRAIIKDLLICNLGGATLGMNTSRQHSPLMPASVSTMTPGAPQWDSVWMLSATPFRVTGTCRMKVLSAVIFIGIPEAVCAATTRVRSRSAAG